jgi:hypothetical protein
MSGRFVVVPSGLLAGRYVVRDERTGMLAVKPNGKPEKPSTREQAEATAARLNRNAICKGCRHRRPAADVVDGRCPTCRGEGSLFPATRAPG